MKKTLGRKILTALPGALLAIIIFVGTPVYSMAYTQVVGIVSADAAKVRKEPNTSSDIVAGLLKGSTVTVTDEVTDSAGTMWYKVSVDNSTGYIRSDLLIKAASTTETTTNTAAAAGTDAKPAPTTATAIAETKAYVNFSSARVREGASTNHEIVGSVTENSPVTITGEANGSDGKKWYQIKYNNQAGREVTGFVRSDLLTIGEPPAAETPAETETTEESAESAEEETVTPEGEASEEVPEVAEEAPAEVVPEVTEKPDYEMVFTANNEGVEEWYLYDNINGTRQTLAGLMAAAEAGAAQSQVDTEQLSTQKIIIIVLAVVAAVLAVAVTLLLFKIKDLYDDVYEDDDDDDEDDDDEEIEDEDDEDEDDEDEDDEEEEEIRVVRKKRPANSGKSARTVTPVRTSREGAGGAAVKTKTTPVKRVEYNPEEEEFEAGAPVAVKQSPKRKAKNFLVDDEFEFEFLNMDDKK